MRRREKAKEFFIRYCEFYKYGCKEIEESKLPGVRTPDLEISANGVKIIAEAKDLNANEKEIRCWRETRSGKIVVHSREPGKRARSLIEDARGQLRPYAETGVPSVVVLYDNILVDGTRPGPAIDWFGPLGPNDIDMALYGLWKANIRLHSDGGTESLGDTRSKWRRIHDRQIISAVCVIYEHPEDGSLFTIVYHNYWASAPLPTNIFTGKNDRHLAKLSDPDLQPNPWERV